MSFPSDSSSEGSYTNDEDWLSNFLAQGGFRQLLVEIPEFYLDDSLSLYGLQDEIKYFNEAMFLIRNGVCPDDVDEDAVSKSAALLYSKAHARYILTPQGLEEIKDKYERGDYGKCPRYLCSGQHLLPHGAMEKPGKSVLRCVCPCCGEFYKAFAANPDFYIDGCFFGPNLFGMFMLTYPHFKPKEFKRYEPRIYGFRIYDPSRSCARQNPKVIEILRSLIKTASH